MKKWFGIFLLLGFLLYPVLSECSNDFDTHFSKGMTYYGKKNFKLAVKEFDTAAKISPDVAKTYYYRAYAKYKIKDFDGSLKDFAQAYSLNKDYSPHLK